MRLYSLTHSPLIVDMLMNGNCDVGC